jgi:hypothetical protein
MKLPFAPLTRHSLAEHQKRLAALGTLRDKLVNRLSQLGQLTRELDPQEIRQLHYELLNPNAARVPKPGRTAPDVQVHQTLWDAATVRREGEHLLELTEGEQLVFEDLEDSETTSSGAWPPSRCCPRAARATSPQSRSCPWELISRTVEGPLGTRSASP